MPFTPQKHYLIHISLALYIIILFFGSLHPITSWQWPDMSNWYDSFEKETRYTPQNDLIINFLIYIPMGLATSVIASKRYKARRLFFIACVSLASLSLIIECLQLFVPSRAHSFVDFGMNTLGASIGAFLHAMFSQQNPLGLSVNRWRHTLFTKGRFTDLGLLAIGAWGMAELSPFLPSLNFLALSEEIISIHTSVSDHNIYLNILGTALEFFAISIIASQCLRSEHSTILIAFTFCAIIFILKLPVDNVTLSFEQIGGLLGGAFLYFILQGNSRQINFTLAIYAVIISFIISQLNHPLLLETHDVKEFNWIPFYFQFNRITHMREILESLWAMSALCFLVLGYGVANLKKTIFIGLIAIGLISFVIEWQQQNLQLSSPDITNIIIAMGIWVLPFLHPGIRNKRRD